MVIFHVEKVISKLDKGATEPIEGIIKGKNVIIKTFKNRYSNKVLINEYICLKLAEKLKMTIPNGGICVIDDKTKFDEELKLDLEYEGTEIDGVGYYSFRIEKAVDFTPNSMLVKMIKNNSEINKLILFDYLIYNDDRHESNILLHLAEAKMYIIDHSHVFRLRPTWNSELLSEYIRKNDYTDINTLNLNYNLVYKPFVEEGILCTKSMINEAENIKKSITPELIDEIISELPDQWIEGLDKDIKALKKYILYRINNIDNIVNIICTYIKKNGGE